MNIKLLVSALCVFIFSEISAFGISLQQACTDELYDTCKGGRQNTVMPNGMCYTNGVCTGWTMDYVQEIEFSGIKRCACQTTTLVCASGQYGVPTSTTASGQCTKCPANATCEFLYNNTFTCKNGFYKVGNICMPKSISCVAGYYLSANNECTQCRQSGSIGYYCPGGIFTASDKIQGRNQCPGHQVKPHEGTSGDTAPGAKAITDCYQPAGSYSDESGSYQLTQNCYYTN